MDRSHRVLQESPRPEPRLCPCEESAGPADQLAQLEPMDTAHNTVLVAVTDIIFYTKVRDALLPQGYRLEKIRSQADITEKAATANPIAVILDMNDQTVNAFQALEMLKADARLKSIPTL